MATSKTKLLLAGLKSAFDGPAWHGPSVKETLAKISSEDMLKSTGKSHNIIELINHMTAWREFAIKKLQRDEGYDVSPEKNFSEVRQHDAHLWQKALNDLEKSKDQLLELIGQIDDEKLKESVEGSSYTYYFLLHGIIHHDIYHLGQIVLLNQLEAKNTPSR